MSSAGWALGWLAVAAIVVAAHMHAFTKLSYIDEFQHVDYLQRTINGDHVRGGQKVGQTSMREQACRGIDYDSILPKCSAKHLRPEQFPGQGFNHTYSDPPTYYVVTGVGAQAVRKVLGVDSLVTAGRSIGILWLAAGLFVSFLLSRRLGADLWAAIGVTLLLAATPAVALSSATITTDAPMLVVGGVLSLAVLAVVEGRRSYWWLAPAAALTMAMKFTALPVVGFTVLFLLLRWRFSSRQDADPPVKNGRVDREDADPPVKNGRVDREDADPPVKNGRVDAGTDAEVPWFRAIGVTLAGALLPAIPWNLYTSATELPAADDIPMGQYFRVDSVTLSHFLNSWKTTVSPVVDPSSPPFLLVDPVKDAVLALNLLLIVGVVALAWFWPVGSRLGSWGVATFLSLVLTGPGFVALLFLTLDVTYFIPGRYGLSLLPAMAGCLAVVASRRPSGAPLLVGLGLLELGLLVGYAL